MILGKLAVQCRIYTRLTNSKNVTNPNCYVVFLLSKLAMPLEPYKTEVGLPFDRLPIGSDLRSKPCAPKQSSCASLKLVGRSIDPEYFRYSSVALRHGTWASNSTPFRTTCFNEALHRLTSPAISSPQRGCTPE